MREVFREGVRWTVHEESAARTPGAKSHRCLIFDSEGIVRRLWAFPNGWANLPDDQILSLLEAPTPAQGVYAVQETGHQHPTVAAAIAAASHAQELVAAVTAIRDANRALSDER